MLIYWLRQLRRVQVSGDTGIHVHAFAESLKATTDKLQRLLNANARVVTGTRRYNGGLVGWVAQW